LSWDAKAEKLKEIQMEIEVLTKEGEQDKLMERQPFTPALSSFALTRYCPSSLGALHEWKNNECSQCGIQKLKHELVKPGCWIWDNLMSQAECKALIEVAESKKFELAEAFCHRYRNRNNDRMVVNDEAYSEEIFNRLRHDLPETIKMADGSTWEVDKINPKWRCCKYYPGHYFGAHLDGMFILDDSHKSLLTIMIYLNPQSENKESTTEQDDGFTGGSTWFLNGDYGKEEEVVPRTGRGVVFYQDHHDYLHEGAPLLTGIKYIMRSDIIYRRISEATHSPPQSQRSMISSSSSSQTSSTTSHTSSTDTTVSKSSAHRNYIVEHIVTCSKVIAVVAIAYFAWSKWRR